MFNPNKPSCDFVGGQFNGAKMDVASKTDEVTLRISKDAIRWFCNQTDGMTSSEINELQSRVSSQMSPAFNQPADFALYVRQPGTNTFVFSKSDIAALVRS